MNDYRWFNQGHPQTLQTATLLLYFEGVLGILFHRYFGATQVLQTLACVGMGVGGFGIANDKRWGYGIAIAAALANVGLVFSFYNVVPALTHFGPLIDLMFGGALIALLLHPMSRNYQRIWFR